MGGWIDRMMREDPDKKKESDRSKSGKKKNGQKNGTQKTIMVTTVFHGNKI